MPHHINHPPERGIDLAPRRASGALFAPHRKGRMGMFNWIRRRRLSGDTRKRLLLVAARAEEAIVETHVNNLLDLLETLDDEIDLDRAIEIYAEMVSLEESRMATVANRLLAHLENPQAAQRPRRYENIFRDNRKR